MPLEVRLMVEQEKEIEQNKEKKKGKIFGDPKVEVEV